MTHSRIPKFTKSRPFGVPQTPFNPKSGKYIQFTNDPDILKVVVERKVSTGSENLYLCSVLDIRSDKSGERLHVNRLVYSAVFLDDIPENTTTFAYKIDNKWWMQVGGESEVPTVDFIVDMFDRANEGNLGQYWDIPALYRLYNQQAVYNYGTSPGVSLYQAKLSSHNVNFGMYFYCGPEDEADWIWYWNWLNNNPSSTTSTSIYLFSPRLGYDIETEKGIAITGRLKIQRYVGSGPIYLYTGIRLSAPGGSDYFINTDVIYSNYSQAILSGALFINVNENIVTMSGAYSGSIDMAAVYNTTPGLGIPYSQFSYVIADNFKAWIPSIPEPPDESGYGRYINGEYVYSDKYHAGGEYNPDA